MSLKIHPLIILLLLWLIISIGIVWMQYRSIYIKNKESPTILMALRESIPGLLVWTIVCGFVGVDYISSIKK